MVALGHDLDSGYSFVRKEKRVDRCSFLRILACCYGWISSDSMEITFAIVIL